MGASHLVDAADAGAGARRDRLLYVARRQLRWLGHVSRMGWERLPRRMLSAWVPHARPRGAPRLTYGRSVAKAMDVFNLDHARWPELAADRARWRAMLQSGEAPPPYVSIDRQPPARARAARAYVPSLDAPPACRGGAHQRRHRRVAASRGADHAPRQDEENLTGWPQPPLALRFHCALTKDRVCIVDHMLHW